MIIIRQKWNRDLPRKLLVPQLRYKHHGRNEQEEGGARVPPHFGLGNMGGPFPHIKISYITLSNKFTCFSSLFGTCNNSA